MLIEGGQEGSREDIASPGRVYFVHRIGWEALWSSLAKEGRAVASVGSDEEWNASAPLQEYRVCLCALAIRDSVIPPTINLENPSEECDLDYTPNVAREKKVRVVLNNSFGFGGHNATLVATQFTG